MNRIGRSVILAIFVCLASCKSGDKLPLSERSQVKNLDDLKQTDFVSTLESPVMDRKNVIYTPAFLFAWDEVKQELKSDIFADDTSSIEFKLLNQSTSYQNSLTDNEYSTEVEIVDGAVIAKAFFNKSLPFKTPLEKIEQPIIFAETEVESFGMFYFDEELVKFCQILYYHDDNNFILKLLPEDKLHEIILVKGLTNVSTLAEALKKTNEFIEQGKGEKLNSEHSWKYELSFLDKFAIPKISFNIETNYQQLQGQKFLTSDNKRHHVDVAYQRTGFVLNENGATVEGEVSVVVDSVGAMPKYPKNMLFDKQFYILIKRVDKQNPYFVMRVENAELLTKR
jgi:hypothetical protein